MQTVFVFVYGIKNMEKTALIISIAVGVLFLVVGGVAGYFVTTYLPGSAVFIADKMSSDVVVASTAYGQVAKADGRNVTVSFGKDAVTIEVGTNVPIYQLAKTASAPQPVSFGDIKVGRTVNISFKVLENRKIQALAVTIMPLTETNK